MVASANVQLAKAGGSKFAVQVVNGDILYAGSYAALGHVSHGTAASRGYAAPILDDTDGFIPLGFNDQQITGDTSASPIVEAFVNLDDVIVKNLTITDDAGDVTDIGRWVYATDDNTFTLTRPSTSGALVGITTRFVAVNTFDVFFYGFPTLCAIALGGQGRQCWLLGTVAPVLTSSGDLLTGILAPCHALITSVYAICVRGPTDSDVNIDANLEIGTTNVTGGVIELAFDDIAAEKKAGTAVTAANRMHAGDLISVEGVVNTAGLITDVGLYNIYAEIELQPGL